MHLFTLTSGLITGILVSYFFPDQSLLQGCIWMLTFCTTILLFFYSKIHKTIRLESLSYSLIFALIFSLIGHLTFKFIHQESTRLESLTEKSLQGFIFKKNISEAGYQTLHLQLQNSYSSTVKSPIGGYFMITLDTLQSTFQLGDQVLFHADYTAFKNDPNPGSFDAAFYYGMHHYIGRAFVTSDAIVKTGTQTNLAIFFAKWQEKLSSYISSLLPSSVSGLAVALLVGAKGEIDQEVINSFQNTGAMHVLAVSGLHVGLILVAIQKFLSLFSRWISRKSAIVISILCIVAFGLISGASPAVVRAVVMFVILAFGQLLDRKGNGLNSLFVSAILLLLYDPYYLFDVGFQLSYAAMLGIFILQKPLETLFYPKSKIITWIWSGTVIGIAATIATTPFILFWFHQFPNYFLLSNLVVMLFGTAVLYLLIGLIVGAWIPYLNLLLIFLVIISIQLLITGIQWVNDIPGGVSAGFEINEITFILLLSGVVLFSNSLFLKRKLNAPILLSFAILIGILSVQRVEKFNQNQLSIFSSNQFCGTIQYNGQLISFEEEVWKKDQSTPILNAAVRKSGLNEQKRIRLKSENKLMVGNEKIHFQKSRNGWDISIGKKVFSYQSFGEPERLHNRALMSKRLQETLGSTTYFVHPL